MVISPFGLPATGISGSRNTAASLSTLASSWAPVAADTPSSPSTTAPAPPSKPSTRRRVLVASGLKDGQRGAKGLVMTASPGRPEVDHQLWNRTGCAGYQTP